MEDYVVIKEIKPMKDKNGYYFQLGNKRIKATRNDVMINEVTLKGDR